MILSALGGGDTRSWRRVCRCGVFPAKGLPPPAVPRGPAMPPGPPRTGHRAWDRRCLPWSHGASRSSIPLRQLGSGDPGTATSGQTDTVLCCPGHTPAPTPSSQCLRWETSMLPSGSDPIFLFCRKFNDWESPPSFFFEENRFFSG